MAKTVVPMTRNVEVKKQFTQEQKVQILDQIADANDVISKKTLELEGLKEQEKGIKADIEAQYNTMSELCGKYRLGYESRWTECVATYKDGEATFVDAKTGEIVEQRAITEQEQLMLNGNLTDAEDIIREASKEEN